MRNKTILATAAGTVLAMSATVLGVPASAEPTVLGADQGPIVPGPTTTPEQPPALAAGVIVHTKAEGPSSEIRAAVATGADDKIVRVVAVDDHTRGYVTRQAMPVAEAQALADEMAKRSDVDWAEPNYIERPAATTWPTPVNDPLAPQLQNVWDTRDLAVTPWPAGGYSVKAPALWGATTAQGVVVAVLDTGIRPNHPDFAGQFVGGYDMVSDTMSANDGDGRDADASDPGDWATADLCYAGQSPSDSSWHGSHVAGTIAAAANNGVGVVGMAPGAKIQPIRVLGRCGGTASDIAAGIRWAAGISVPGVPNNPTPARILNMSLGGYGSSCPSTYQYAIDEARAQGSSIFIALGNDAKDATLARPANCNGIIGVYSSSAFGDQTTYSNFGAQADVAAPGGQNNRAGDTGILSTIDSGTTTPVAPAYARYNGTSMAAPAAAGLGALIYSLGEGRFSPDALEATMRAAVVPFPTGGPAGFNPCSTSRCGTGITDATTVPAPLSSPVIAGTPAAGSTLSVVDEGSWGGAPAARTISWYANGAFVGSGLTYVVPSSSVARTIVAVSHVASGPFAPIGRTSNAIAVPANASQPPVVKRKKRSRIIIKGDKTIRPRTWRPLKFILKVRGIRRPTGKLTVYIDGRRVHKTKIKRAHKGRLRLRIKLSRGRHKVKFVYSGNKRIKRARKVVKYVAR
jgi:serine protease